MSIGIWQQVVCKYCKWNLSNGIKARLVVVVPYLSSMVFSFGYLGVYSSLNPLLTCSCMFCFLRVCLC